jgi:hypothetical protein
MTMSIHLKYLKETYCNALLRFVLSHKALKYLTGFPGGVSWEPETHFGRNSTRQVQIDSILFLPPRECSSSS